MNLYNNADNNINYSTLNITLRKINDTIYDSIIKRYDEIENQNLSSQEMKEFISSTKLMLKSADEAFNKILERLYQNDMINIDADMKVFNSMLKADGYDNEEIIKEDNNE